MSPSSTMTAILEPRAEPSLAWEDEQLSYTEMLRRVRAWKSQVQVAGGPVVVFGENGPAWVLAAYAIWAAGSVLVPVDHMSTAEELAYVLDDCTPALVLCTRHLLSTVERSLEIARHKPEVLTLEDLEARPRLPSAPTPEALTVDESALAAIVYTSGTTGTPKGVMLSFGNLLANVRPVARAGYFTPDARVLLLLPLHHVLPLAGSLVAPLFVGAKVVFATSLAGDTLVSVLQRHSITTIIGVPRFYDLLHRALRERIATSPIARGLFAVARRLRSPAFSRLVFGSVHRRFGGALRHLVCGGAALNQETAETFDVLGFRICEGYGMTECSPMIAFPRPDRIKLGSCGQVLDGCDVRLTEEGEIVTRGPNVMLGYYGRPEETQAVLRDGWLHTGDLGHLDEEGYLYVTGRLKELIVLASGKKVSPSTIEGELEVASPAVREAAVFLDGDTLHALIVPDFAHVPNPSGADAEPERGGQDSAHRRAAETLLRREVIAPYNAAVAPYRRVARLTVVSKDLPRTRLGKLRRHLLPGIGAQYANATPASVCDHGAHGETTQRLAEFFERQGKRAANASSRLTEDLGIDSLGRVELSVYLERRFGVSISETQLLEVENLGELARLVDRDKTSGGEVPADVSWSELLHPKTEPALPRTSVWHWLIVYLSRILVRALFRLESHGISRIPAGSFILVPNHQSYLDGLFVCAPMRPDAVLKTLFYAKERHVRRPWLKALARRCNTIVMDPTRGFLGSLQQLAAGLRRGYGLIVFPEGTRSRDGVLGPFKDSYAILASELSVPVVPVVIEGAHAVLPAGRRFPRFLGRISVTFLEPLRPDAGEPAAHFNARVRELIAAELNKSD